MTYSVHGFIIGWPFSIDRFKKIKLFLSLAGRLHLLSRREYNARYLGNMHLRGLFRKQEMSLFVSRSLV
jgi:hypothetical protein